MASVKTVGGFALVNAVLGIVVGSAVGAKFLGWYNTAGGSSMCNCTELAASITRGMIEAQLGGAAAGTVAGIVMGIFWVRYRRARAKAAAHALPPASTPAVPPAAEPPKG